MRAERITGTGIRADGLLSVSEWKSLLTEAELQQMMARFAVPLSEEEGWWLLHVEEGELLRLSDAVLPKLVTSLQSGQEESALPAKMAAYVQELNATSISDTLKTIGEKTLQEYLKPTYVPDERATENAREAAAEAIAPVEIKRGDIIVTAGEVVRQEQYDLLRTLELVRSDKADMRLNIGLGLFLLCLFGVFGAYMVLYERSVFLSTRKMLIIAVATTLTMLVALAFNFLAGRIPPVLIGVMLVALLVDGRTAMAVGALQAFVVALLAGGRGNSMLGYESTVIAASMFVGGQLMVFLLRGHQKRGSLIATSAIAGLASAAVIAAAGVMTARSLQTILISVAWAAGSNVMCGIIVVGTLSLWENLFDVATSARLNELTNANNPLLRQLMTEAPGTYHHSMMTAALAEGAAEAIGADALLCRVGAYYHDAGKLRRPLYFKENQKPNENIHDTLPAAESASIIISHLKDGVVMLNRNKLPSAVVQIAYEHHGTTMAAYFFHKAAQEAGGKAPPQKNFRYPGARPSSRESAIVHLADSCEAAVRSLESPTREDVEALVEKIIKGKMDDGQLAAAPLDFKDIAMIQQSFLRTFAGLLHERIAYPEQKGGKA